MTDRLRFFALPFVVLCAGMAAGQEPPAHEGLAHWQWYLELAAPQGAGRMDCILTPAVFDKAREDLGDLRLIDGAGREIPYAIRVRRSRVELQESRQGVQPGAPPRRLGRDELRPGPQTARKPLADRRAGRRQLPPPRQLQGSDDGADWRTLVDDGPLVSLRVGDQAIDARTLSYPASRFRYLRVRVYPDKAGDDKVDPPRVKVWRAAEKEGEDYSVAVAIGPRDPIPTPGGPGSAWFLSVRDAHGADLEAYWERLSFDVANTEFSRSYFVEAADPSTGFRRSLVEERWLRAPGDEAPLTATFTEVRARRLRLVVTDNRDPPLQIQTARSTTAARQLVFTPPAHWAPPLRLYFGNPQAAPGRYNDYADALPAVLDPAPTRIRLASYADREDVEKNPAYQEPPKPFTERFPWLIYVVLGLAGLTLLGILLYFAPGRRAA